MREKEGQGKWVSNGKGGIVGMVGMGWCGDINLASSAECVTSIHIRRGTLTNPSLRRRSRRKIIIMR